MRLFLASCVAVLLWLAPQAAFAHDGESHAGEAHVASHPCPGGTDECCCPKPVAVPAQPRSRHLRLDRDRDGDFPVWLFAAEDLSFDLTVLPQDVLRQAPLSGIDEKPMKRASAAQLRALLAEDEIAGYEAAAG